MEPWRRLDEADEAHARALLRACCGSARWVDAMTARRPFGGGIRLHTSARDIWFALDEQDWREAFSHHPKIGDRESLRRRFAATGHLSEREQQGVDGAAEGALAELADANSRYERKFGFIFIVRASGRTAEEMLALLRARLDNDPGTEIHVAAAQQAEITALRLDAIG
jgi:2-oxo-4-hydroxy-4-carboxy-5-ureidoimidazoline decarboxylase